ncbi:MAG: YggS family pyridoxal phosphate-dependent enzyme [Clostridia bacterium]|nr:YggS family pyridoxal phosphate-dependent enzyme [Clostridia bacterium]
MTERSSIDEREERFAAIRSNLAEIRKKLAAAEAESPYKQKTSLLLATKTRTPEEINYAISLGVDLIGENRVQELLEKYDAIDKSGVKIHFIGALQTNKVKYIIDKVDMIESVDRMELAREIEKQAAKKGVVMDVLCEINVGREKSKSGVMPEDAENLIREMAKLPHLRVRGLMAIPPVLSTEEKQMEYFQKIMSLCLDISAKKIDNVNMAVLSIGMSSDYELAARCGSTEVRIGTGAFGPRQYQIK